MGPSGPTLGLELAQAPLPDVPDSATTKTVELSSIPHWVPGRVGSGDDDFDGHGPAVHAEVQLSAKNGKLWARIYMRARETQSDYTEAAGSNDFVVYDGPETILAIAPGQDTYSAYDYTDSNHADDVFDLPAGELVRTFRFVGDTDGGEAGTRTGVAVSFQPVNVIVQ